MQEIEINHRKNELRAQFKSLRKTLLNAEKAQKDKKIAQNLFSIIEFEAVQGFLCYISKSEEIDTELIIESLLKSGKTVAAPKMRDSEGNMDFYIVSSLDDTEKSAFNVREPIVEKCKKLSDLSNSVCIIPALAFDKKGYRLGYGKGCYDRFLKDFNGLKIGLCYQNCLVDSLPKGEFDMAADVVVTENEIIYVKENG